MKIAEPQSKDIPTETLVIIAVFILISIFFCALFVYLSVWVYRLSRKSNGDEENNEADSRKSDVSSTLTDKNESIQENTDNNEIESDKASINTTDSLDLDKQNSSKRYTNLKNLNKNNNNNSNSQENLNNYLQNSISRTPSDNFLVRDIVCDEFSNKSGSRLDYSIDYKSNYGTSDSDKINNVARKNYHSACTNISSGIVSENNKDKKQNKQLNSRINRSFVFK